MDEQYIAITMAANPPNQFEAPPPLSGQQLRNIQSSRRGDSDVRALLAEIKRLHVVLGYIEKDAGALEIFLRAEPERAKGPLSRIQHALSLEPSILATREAAQVTSGNSSGGRSRTR